MTKPTALLAAMLAAAPLLAAAPASGPARAIETVAGIVFLDANGNAALDPGEKGIPGVRVTDGVHFVSTGPDGRYSIPIAPDAFFPHQPARTVSVCWPTGHWPSGPWWRRLSDVSDPAAVHFPLRPDKQAIPFLYVQESDSHGDKMDGMADFARFVNASGQVKFLVDTGDTAVSKEMVDIEKRFHAPYFHAIGNHDTVNADNPPPDLAGYGAWTKYLGPIRWSFDYAGVHVAGFDGADVAIPGKSEPLDWLERDFKSLPKGTRILLFYHYPNPDSPRFERLLKDYNVRLCHAGHNHTYFYWGDMGWPTPLYTAYTYRPPGTANVGVVTADSADLAVWCIGCRKGRYAHSRRCPIVWRDSVLPAAIGPHFDKLHTLPAGPLAGAAAPVPLAQPRAYIRFQFHPGQAASVGLKLAPAGGGKPVEVSYDGTTLHVAGAPMPFVPARPDGLIDLSIFVQANLLTIWADPTLLWEKPAPLPAPASVTAFAAGGAADIKLFTVQEVKPDPTPYAPLFPYPGGAGGLRRAR